LKDLFIVEGWDFLGWEFLEGFGVGFIAGLGEGEGEGISGGPRFLTTFAECCYSPVVM